MKVKVIKRSENELRLEIAGEGHSFCSALQSALLRDSTIDFAGYYLAHPLAAEPEIYVRTKGSRRPEDALLEAANTLKKELSGLQEVLEKAFEGEE